MSTTEPNARTEPMHDRDVEHLRRQLALGGPSRRAVAGVGFGCLGLGVAVGAILGASGEMLGAILFPTLLTPTGALFLWLATRARRTIELDLADGHVAVHESTVQAKREMKLPRSTAYSLQMEGRDVFVDGATYAKIERGDRVRIRRAPHSGIALATEKIKAASDSDESRD